MWALDRTVAQEAPGTAEPGVFSLQAVLQVRGFEVGSKTVSVA